MEVTPAELLPSTPPAPSPAPRDEEDDEEAEGGRVLGVLTGWGGGEAPSVGSWATAVARLSTSASVAPVERGEVQTEHQSQHG